MKTAGNLKTNLAYLTDSRFRSRLNNLVQHNQGQYNQRQYNQRQYNQRQHNQGQQGAVLMIVLLLLLLMATASLIAVRSANTSLDLTTTYQINQLLFQASDAPLRQLDRLSKDKEQLGLLTADSGPFGYLSKQGINPTLAEYTVCYQPKLHSTIYSASSAKIITDSKETINPDGYCNLADSDSNHFVSDRKIIATQLSFVRLNSVELQSLEPAKSKNTIKTHTATPFSGPLGQDLASNTQTHIRLYVTSVMPSFSRARLGEIDSCLAKPVTINTSNDTWFGKTENQFACLKRTGTPFNTQVQDYVFSYQAVPDL